MATSVCRTCKNIISKTHNLDLFGEKESKDGIARDLQKFHDLKSSLDDGLPLQICRTCYAEITKFQDFLKTVVHLKVQPESVI